jgi:uroporphyrinogen-III synthase
VRELLLLRPEPGLSGSAERARHLGLKVISCPLFRIEPVEWQIPDPSAYDALLLTSANAVRHGGPGLASMSALAVHAVGEATAAAARAAGLKVDIVGDSNLSDLLATLPADLRLLHLAGADHVETDDARIDRRVVYVAAEIPAPGLPQLDGLVVAIHSPRAGARLATLAGGSASTAIAAISQAAAVACGAGWERVDVSIKASDTSLLALASMLCHTSAPR